MAFTPASIFSSPLHEGAERYARGASSSTPGPSIIYEIGWNTLLISEQDGGYGGSFDDLGAVIEGTASHAVNLPIITRCGIVPAILNALGQSGGAAGLRHRLASGDARLEWAGTLGWQDPATLPQLADTGNSLSLSGIIEPIELTDDCTHVMLAAFDVASREIVLVLLEAEKLRSLSNAYISVDGRRTCSAKLETLELADNAILARGATGRHALMTGWQSAQALACTDIVCSMNRALSETVAYLQQRKQFGQPLAEFQALRHDVAKLYVNFEACKGLLISTIRLLENEDQSCSPENLAAFHLLGLHVRDQAVEFAQSVIQLHGGMGMTSETLAARLATRMIAHSFRFGDAYHHTKSLLTFQGAQER